MGKLLRLAQGLLDNTLTKKEQEEALANERVVRQYQSLKAAKEKEIISEKPRKVVKKNG